jgi:hypothetical protein
VFGVHRDPEYAGGERTKSGTFKHNPMVAAYGPGPEDRRCWDCAHLLRYQAGGTWFKCDLRYNTGGAATDHRARWPTCARFEERS